MKNKLDWKAIYFGRVGRDEVQRYTPDPRWQKIRLSMKGRSTEEKYGILCRWLETEGREKRSAQVQVTNYVTALSRGGLIKPEDYLG